MCYILHILLLLPFIDGGISEWSDWVYVTNCSATCGPNGMQERRRERNCTNPPPLNGGYNCEGIPTVETNMTSCLLMPPPCGGMQKLNYS